MKKATGIIGLALAGATLMVSVASAAAGSSHSGPYRHRRRGGPDQTYSVPEPGSLALLGAGLISIGLLAKRTLGKRS